MDDDITGEIYRCHLCTYTGNSKYQFNIHMNTHFDHKCSYCDYTSRTEGRLKRHIRDFHSEIPPESWAGTRVPRKSSSNNHNNNNNNSSNNNNNLNNSNNSSNSNNNNIDEDDQDDIIDIDCDATNDSMLSDDGSLCDTSENGGNGSNKPRKYKCKQCNFIAISKSDFWEHNKNHIKSEKLLTCPKCSFVTEYKHHLEYHLRNHFGSKPFKCAKCNYSCVNKSMLNSHMKSHSNIYQYRCADCSYATKYCHSLKLHLRKYCHKPATVLNLDGTPNPYPIIDVYGTRRGPRPKKNKDEKNKSNTTNETKKNLSSPTPSSISSTMVTLPSPGSISTNASTNNDYSLLSNGVPSIPFMSSPNNLSTLIPNSIPMGLPFLYPPLFTNTNSLLNTTNLLSTATTSPNQTSTFQYPNSTQSTPRSDIHNSFTSPSSNSSIADESIINENNINTRMNSIHLNNLNANQNQNQNTIKHNNSANTNGANNNNNNNNINKSNKEESKKSNSNNSHLIPLKCSFCEFTTEQRELYGKHLLMHVTKETMSDTRKIHSPTQSTNLTNTMNGSMSTLLTTATTSSTYTPSIAFSTLFTDLANKNKIPLTGIEFENQQKALFNELLARQSSSPNSRKLLEQIISNPVAANVLFNNSMIKMDNNFDEQIIGDIKESKKTLKIKHSKSELISQNMNLSSNVTSYFDTFNLRNEQRPISAPVEPVEQMEENEKSPPRVKSSPSNLNISNVAYTEAKTKKHEKEMKTMVNKLSTVTNPVFNVKLTIGEASPLDLSHNRSPERMKLLNYDENLIESKLNYHIDWENQNKINSRHNRRKGKAVKLERNCVKINDSLIINNLNQVNESDDEHNVNDDNEHDNNGDDINDNNGAINNNNNNDNDMNTNDNHMNDDDDDDENDEDDIENDGEKWDEGFTCSYCDISFRDCVMYTMHMGYHGYGDPFTCNMCGHQSRDKVAFFLHIARAAHM